MKTMSMINKQDGLSYLLELESNAIGDIMKKIIVDCCRHCPFVDFLDEYRSGDLQERHPYCTQPGIYKDNPDIEDVDVIPAWCGLEDDT